MRGRERVLLALTLVGFVVPNAMLIAFVAEHGVDVGRYLEDVTATLPATQFTLDLAIAATAFLVWTGWDGPRAGVARWWAAVPATFLVGICFGLPLYLLQRERALRAPAAG